MAHDRLGKGCSHVAAIKVEAGVRLGYTSCTSQQCLWNETHTDKVNLYHIVKVLLFSTFRLNYLSFLALIFMDIKYIIFIFVCIPLSNKGVQVTFSSSKSSSNSVSTHGSSSNCLLAYR